MTSFQKKPKEDVVFDNTYLDVVIMVLLTIGWLTCLVGAYAVIKFSDDPDVRMWPLSWSILFYIIPGVGIFLYSLHFYDQNFQSPVPVAVEVTTTVENVEPDADTDVEEKRRKSSVLYFDNSILEL